METIYLAIVVFLLCLAVFDLFVGVSNDAVNFLNSAIGAKVAKFRTVLIVASAGVAIGAVMSSGMMDVARHGIMQPANFSFYDVMTIFLAVMVTDVIVLDMFNTLGMPTSTTVSLVFELLGGTFVLAAIKIAADPTLGFADLLNTDKALSVIVAIFVSVAIAFFFGMIVQWFSRIVFTFNYKKHSRYSIALFGGIAFTALSYFIFLKGLGKSRFIAEDVRTWIDSNISLLLLYTFIGSTIMMQVLHMLRVNVFKFVVLMGTFALAMAFAGNDLVNFIGVPLAGMDSFRDYVANSNGLDARDYMMTSLMESAQTPPFFLACLVAASGLLRVIFSTSEA
jgi:phosphate/sulfate permease